MALLGLGVTVIGVTTGRSLSMLLGSAVGKSDRSYWTSRMMGELASSEVVGRDYRTRLTRLPG